jgi:serpin B
MSQKISQNNTLSAKLTYLFVFSLVFIHGIGAQEEYVSSAINRNNSYSITLFKSLAKNENMAISPFGISNLMAMVYIGSEGQTQQVITNKMNFITPFGVLVSYKNLIKQLQIYKNNDINLMMGNALWNGSKKDIEKKYKNLLKVNFSAHVQDLNFSNEENVKQINRWVKKSSNFNVLSLLKPEELSNFDELVYTNYLFLEGNLENSFNEQLTSKDDFFLNDGSKKKVDFMNQTSYLRYNENEIFQILELPYAGKNLSMIVLLPKAQNLMDTLITSLNPINFDFWTSELYTKLVNLAMPKFRIEQTYTIARFLNDGGMEFAFTAQANYSRISKEPVLVSKLIQKTIIQFAENKAGNYRESMVSTDQLRRAGNNNIIRFHAGRPFIFIIKDNRNNNIFMTGHVSNPSFNNISSDYQ